MALKSKSVSSKTQATEEEILSISQGVVNFAVVGTSPFIFNRMTEKAKRQLLMPPGKKNAAEKASSLKHNPIEEYRDSCGKWLADDHPTRLKVPSPSFKGAMLTAALVLPGTRKTEIGRLVWVVDEYKDFFGVPELLMSVVRSADMNRTPDIRTRAIVREWASLVTVRFVQPNLNAKSVANLMAAGGIVSGVGDFRQEKGKGNFGQYRIADLDDPDFVRITANGGRKAQDAALEKYRCYDAESQELLDWYSAEVIRLGRDKPKKEAA